MSTSTVTHPPVSTQAIAERLDPDDGSSHPPQSAQPASPRSRKELRPALRWMRGQMVREFVRKMRRQHLGGHGGTLRKRMRKRKTALVMSAAVMGLSTGAADMFAPDPQSAISFESVDPTKNRVHALALQASEAMKEALAEEEGVRLVVYRDVAGYPTVGLGHLVRPEDGLSVGDRITYDQAIAFLERDMKEAEAGAKRLLGDLPVYQHEFDALVDLVYNVGEGNVSPDTSPQLNEAIANEDYDAIAAQLTYTTATGRIARGLEFRSERRQSIFMEAHYDDPRAVDVGHSRRAST